MDNSSCPSLTHPLYTTLEAVLEEERAGDGVVVGHSAEEEVLWQAKLGECAAAPADDGRLRVHLEHRLAAGAADTHPVPLL